MGLPGWIMRRAPIGVLLVFFGAAAAAEPLHPDAAAHEPARVFRLFDSNWELHRPQACELKPFDLGYLGAGSSAGSSGIGLRFRPQRSLTLQLRLDPVIDRDALVGPVYDAHIGAATLSLTFSF